MRQDPHNLKQLLRPVVEGMGYEFVGVEFLSRGRDSLLRLYIDSPDGINLKDCEQVSHQVSGVLDVSDPITERYTLEVSSPGLDRPLFERQHFESYLGQQARLQLSLPVAGRRRFTGLLKALQDETLIIECDGVEWALPLNSIDRARLVPEW